MGDSRLILNSAVRSRSLLYLALVALPFELPATQIAHSLLSGWLGEIYILAHPFTVLIVAYGATLAPAVRIDRPVMVRLLFLVVCGIGVALSSHIFASNPITTLRYLYFGLGSSALAMLIFMESRNDPYILTAFCIGILVWGLMVFAAWVFFAVSTPVPFDRLPERLLSLRSPGEKIANRSLFFDLAGNVNKVANYAVLFMLMLGLVHWRGLLSPALYWLSQALMVAILIVTFSRGAFVALALLSVVLGLAYALRWREQRSSRYLVLAAILLVPVAISVSDGYFRDYWRNLDTVAARINQASEVVEPKQASEVAEPIDDAEQGRLESWSLVLGYGTGNYGRAFFGDSIRGTHNLFLDTWTNGGLIALLGLVGFVASTLWLALTGLLRRWDDGILVGGIGTAIIIVLAFREYDLAYLYATSMGGILLGACAGLSRPVPVT